MNAIVKDPRDIKLSTIQTFYLGAKAVCYKTAVSRSTIDKLEMSGRFPRRITLSQNKVVWTHSEVHNWCILVKSLGSYPELNYYLE